MRSPWFVRPRPRPDARLRLVCFSYAGMGASVYARWPDSLPHEIDLVAVQIPGRESRLREPAFSSVQLLADAVAREVESLIPQPVALFGHSMGAVVAVEVARVLAQRGHEPAHLFVSSRRPPHIPDRDPPMRALSDSAFVEEIGRRYSAIPAAIVEDSELFALLLPALRTDIAALETHPVQAAPPLSCGVTAYGGSEDLRAPRGDIDAWRDVTTGAFRVRMFTGGHFYLTEHRAELVADVGATLAALLSRNSSDVPA